jgi:phosphoserine phosphatase RsbU/P
MNRFSARRVLVFLGRISLLDRIAFAILALFAASRVATALGHAPPFASFLAFLCFVAVVYLCVRLAPVVRQHLLWRLRNRLIVAYVFMAIIPVALLLTMVGITAYMLELQIGAHLLTDNLQGHIGTLAADTDAIVAAISLEPGVKPDPLVPSSAPAVDDPVLSRPGVASVIAAAQKRWPDLHVYVNHGQQLVRARGGQQFAGLAEFRSQLWFASAQSLAVGGGRATVLVVAPVTTPLLDSLPSKLGPIRLTLLDPAPANSVASLTVEGKRYVSGAAVASSTRSMAPAAYWFDMRVNGVATLEAFRADLGAEASQRPVMAQFSLRLSAVNKDLLTSVGAWGPVLVDVLLLAGMVFLVLELAALATGIVLTRTITGSVADLYDATRHIRRGDFTHRVHIRRRDQLGALGESFNEMTSSLSDLIEGQRSRQRLEHEVAIAREVQQQLFPQSFPSLPGLELAAVCRPARMVSGDYYDFFPLGRTRAGIVLADISGKGIFAALLMASLQAMLRSSAAVDAECGTAEVVKRVSSQLFQSTSEDRYATLFYAVYDSEAKTLTYTNAGHLAPLLITDGRVQQLDQGGMVVGVFDDSQYAQRTLDVPLGSLLVAFSDGLTEPENVYGEEFGIERLRAEILRQRALPAARLAENLVLAVEQWAGMAEQSDDMTVVVARMG